MVRLVIVLILSFICFITVLIILTRKEEAVEKEIKESHIYVTGKLDKVVRDGKSISKGILKYLYSATYIYKVDGKQYSVKTKYEVNSDCLDPLPETVHILYSKKNPKNSLVELEVENKYITQKEMVHSLAPSIIIAVVFGIILFHFFVVRLF